MLATPINPLDLIKLTGSMRWLKLPYTLGSECAAEIVFAKGKNESLIGKKISTLCDGSWSEYISGSFKNCIIHHNEKEIDLN